MNDVDAECLEYMYRYMEYCKAQMEYYKELEDEYYKELEATRCAGDPE